MRNKIAVISIIALVLSFVSINFAHPDENAKQEQQKFCPVITSNPINKKIFLNYEGKVVYFCCKMCIATFKKSPKKYIARLPQFHSATKAKNKAQTAPTTAKIAHGSHDHSASPDLVKFIKPLGISTFSLLFITILSGLCRRKLSKRFLLLHKTFVTLTVILALSHIGIILSS